MLHEILLALAGHASPLFEPESFSDKQNAASSLPALSVSEKQLLANIGALSRLHRRLKQHLDAIVQKHSSMICRATANSLRQTHLGRFQAKLLEVEASILRKDASTVGAYDIVPLAYIVGQFSDWQRRMSWHWTLATFVLPVDGKTACTGAALIDKLRADAQTGFPDIEEAATELSKVAESTWLKQLAPWVLYGKINPLGKDDFFVQEDRNETGQQVFRKNKALLPKFVSSTTANSILFIGRSLHQLRENEATLGRRAQSSQVNTLRSTHMRLISTLSFPILAAELNRTIAALRSSLSRNVLQDLLPINTTRIALQAFRKFFLLSDNDFAACLINEAERRVEARWQTMDRLALQDPVKALQGLSIKDAETSQVLRQTWKLMASAKQEEDETVDFARKHITLNTSKKAPSRPSTSDSTADERLKLSPVSFHDLLFASSTSMNLLVKPPLDLFLSAFDIGVYSTMNAHLLSIRRAQLRLEDLWRRNSARRTAFKATKDRQMTLRRVWAVCSATLLLLTELAAYLGSDVISPSCEHFEAWACASTLYTDGDEDRGHSSDDADAQKDPETLAAGHRMFLDSLAYGMLLNDVSYTKELRSLLGAIDQLTSLFIRTLDLQDISRSSQQDTPAKEQQRLHDELGKACLKVDNDRRSVVIRLRDLHQLRVGPDRYLSAGNRETGGFGPWKTGGLDHLLMKLEYGQPSDGTDV